MIWYDAIPLRGYGIDKFEGDRHCDKHVGGIYRSFKTAQQHAVVALQEEIKELQAALEEIKALTPETCPLVKNPFD